MEERAGHILAAANTPYELSGDAWSGLYWLNPNNFEWVDVNLAASLMTRGRALTGRHLLVGVELDIDPQGVPVVRLELTPETRGGGGFVVGNLVPNVASLDFTIPPIQQAYSGNFGAPSSWNTTDFPPFTQDNMGNMGFPVPQDQAADEAAQNAAAGTRSFAISFANSVAVQAGFNSVLGEPYTITMQGSAKISDDAWGYSSNLVANADDFGIVPGELGQYVAGQGFITGFDFDNQIRELVAYRDFDAALVRSVTIAFDAEEPPEGFDASERPMLIRGLLMGVEVFVESTTIVYGEGIIYAWSGSETIDRVEIQLTPSNLAGPGDIGGGARLYRVNFSGIGDNPFTGEPGVELYGDGAGYIWNISEDEETEGEEINVMYDGSRGLYIQNAPIASPPLYNESHVYSVTWEGDGNNPELKYSDNDYNDNQALNLNLNISGPGAGT